MKIILIALLLLLSLNLIGQNKNLDTLTNTFTSQLLKNQIDTILIYKDGCVGCESIILLEVDDSIISIGDPKFSYIFWRKGGKDFTTKIIDYDLIKYDTISFSMNTAWNLFFNNKLKIANEKILPVIYKENKDTIYVSIDHYLYSQIVIIYPTEKVVYEINEYNFIKDIDDKYQNLNYNHNNLTYKKLLQELITKKVKEIEDNKLIKTIYSRKKI
jgi:hypothetical protein